MKNTMEMNKLNMDEIEMVNGGTGPIDETGPVHSFLLLSSSSVTVRGTFINFIHRRHDRKCAPSGCYD